MPRKIDQAILERDQKALEMKRKGYQLKEIASKLGICDESYASKVIKKAIKKYQRKCQEDASEVVTMMIQRMNDIINAAYKDAMNGDPKAAATIIAADKRLAELLGLDAPTKHEHSGDIHIFPPAKTVEPENA